MKMVDNCEEWIRKVWGGSGCGIFRDAVPRGENTINLSQASSSLVIYRADSKKCFRSKANTRRRCLNYVITANVT
jgi:hypothetical protein